MNFNFCSASILPVYAPYHIEYRANNTPWIVGSKTNEDFRTYNPLSLFEDEEKTRKFFQSIIDVGLYDNLMSYEENFYRKLDILDSFPEDITKKIIDFCNIYGITGNGENPPQSSLDWQKIDKMYLEIYRSQLYKMAEIREIKTGKKKRFYGQGIPRITRTDAPLILTTYSMPLHNIVQDIFNMHEIIEIHILNNKKIIVPLVESCKREPDSRVHFAACTTETKAINYFLEKIKIQFIESGPHLLHQDNTEKPYRIEFNYSSLREVFAILMMNSLINECGFTQCRNDKCNVIYQKKINNSVYCSPECRNRHHRRKSYYKAKDLP